MSELHAETYRRIDDVNGNQWNNVVSQSKLGSLYNRHEWMRAIESGYDFEPRHVVVEKKGNPVAIMPNFVRELPVPDSITHALLGGLPFESLTSTYPGYGGPLILSDEREALDLLFEELESSRGPTLVYHRIQSNDLSHVRYGRYLQDRGYQPRFDSCLFFVNLGDGWESIRDDMDKERRKDLRKAEEQDYTVDVAPLADDFDGTYDAYARNTERVGGTVRPRAFIESLADAFGEQILVFTARVDGREVGRYVHLLDEEASVLRHWLSAIPERENYRYRPSELLHARAIRFGIEEGYDEYGFGVADAHFHDGVFRFKRKYGARPVPMFRMEKGYSRVVWPLYRLGRRLVRRRGI
ncbi:GNAT family N-acetyltransferase [Halorarum salinum]|uniref:GNAT family N-acetyltransferase n=1 Tax=Halorarum salinum TaxID=2743089 RepID=A0A7D5QFW1_9EURY|nr:GNAT family N-acetyltransferase [Halobaculum salinum]QLG61004.1 GNAT family N-acetyltransferase [Halobaculum salinum]